MWRLYVHDASGRVTYHDAPRLGWLRGWAATYRSFGYPCWFARVENGKEGFHGEA